MRGGTDSVRGTDSHSAQRQQAGYGRSPEAGPVRGKRSLLPLIKTLRPLRMGKQALSHRLISISYHTGFFKTTETVRLQTASALLGVKSRPSMRNCLFSRPVQLCYNINAVSLRQKGALESPVRRLTIHDRLCDRNFIDLGFAQNLA